MDSCSRTAGVAYQAIAAVDWYKSLIQWHDTLKSVVQHDGVL